MNANVHPAMRPQNARFFRHVAVALWCAATELTVTAFAGPPACSFLSPQSYSLGGQLKTLTAADIDGDGDLDLLVAANTAASPSPVKVLLNDGGGGFSNGGSFPATDNPSGLAAADIDGDGDADLLVSGFIANNAVRLLNDGAGGFGARLDLGTFFAPTHLAAADLDGDGDVDFAVPLNAGDAVRLRFGDGAGDFPAAGQYTVGADPSRVAVGDLDGDGDPDLVTSNALADSVSVLLNQGDGTMAPAAHYAAGDDPRGLALGDLDHDGDLDVVTANWSGAAGNTVSILLNDGNGVLGAAAAHVAHSGTYRAALSDLNGDGELDLVVAVTGTDGVSVSLGRGDGSFEPAQLFTLPDLPLDVIVADLDADGAPDIATSNQFGTVTVLINDCDTPPPPGPIQILWQTSVDLGGNDQLADFVAADAAGNVLLAGRIHPGLLAQDYWVAKLDGSGNPLWQATLDSGNNRFDDPLDMTTAPNGDLIVTGRMDGPGNVQAWGTARFDAATGNLLWLRDLPGTTIGVAYAVASDPAGNVAVAGWANPGTGACAMTALYDPTGNLLWRECYPPSGGGFARDVVCDAAGNVYVTGTAPAASGVGSALYVVKYDPAGTLLFDVRVDQINDPNGHSGTGSAITLDPDGNVLVAGHVLVPGVGDNLVAVKISPAGTVLWARRFSEPFDTVGQAVGTDAAGNVYVSGRLESCCARLVVYDATGNLLGSDFVNDEVNDDNPRGHLVVRPDGLALLLLQAAGDMVLHAFDAQATLLWSELLDGGTATDLAGGISLRPDGDLAVAGGHTPAGGTGLDALAMRIALTQGQTPGDIDGDGDVDLIDLSLLLNAFGTCSGDAGFDPNADFDGSGCVDLVDLSTLLNNFGA